MAQATQNLRAYLNAHDALGEPEVADVLYQLTNGLLEAGDWVHRDLKPENVLNAYDRWQIADFGIARLAEAPTATVTLKNALSPPYAAPEQWQGVRASHATDIYSLG